jgi:glycosyltransferase involved in cell wall biosynthesis
MKIAVHPRDPNPYQAQLYGALSQEGVDASYVGELTPSQTLSLLLLPVELIFQRLAGARILHVHWLYRFRFPGAGRVALLRHAGYLWLRVVLSSARACGMRVVWTAHNVLPHQPIFPDDLAARLRLIRSADLVIGHSEAAREEIEERLERPRASAVIPIGPPPVKRRRCARASGTPLELLFFGVILPYKGVEELLEAFGRIADDVACGLTIAGRCEDSALRRSIERSAEPLGDRVRLHLAHVPDAELPGLLGAHDVLVLPFRQVTTSSSAMLGLSTGMPVLVPDLPAFRELPLLRYSDGVGGLAARLVELARCRRDELEEIGEAGRRWIGGTSWTEIARLTKTAFDGMLDGDPEAVPARLSGEGEAVLR